jgi:hypothetical protein
MKLEDNTYENKERLFCQIDENLKGKRAVKGRISFIIGNEFVGGKGYALGEKYEFLGRKIIFDSYHMVEPGDYLNCKIIDDFRERFFTKGHSVMVSNEGNGVYEIGLYPGISMEKNAFVNGMTKHLGVKVGESGE